MGHIDVKAWPKNWSTQIGRRLRELRDIAGLSAQAVSDRCTALGHQIPRSTIANIESGRKEALPVHEITVLALALGVPPNALLFPITGGEDVQVAPGQVLKPWAAWRWFSGDDLGSRTNPTELNAAARHVNSALRFYKSVTEGIEGWLHLQYLKEEIPYLGDLGQSASSRSHLDNAMAELVQKLAGDCDFLIRQNLQLPEMPSQLESEVHDALNRLKEKDDA